MRYDVAIKTGIEKMRIQGVCLQTITDYSPFGVALDGRTMQQGDGYRYGFGGMEKDDEVKGSGNSYTAEFWQYDSRIGKRWNIDPVVKFHESPYAAFANNPIWFKDPNGADTTLDASSRVIVKDMLNPESANYNETFAKDFQKLVTDNTTLYSFKQWDKPNKQIAGKTVYGVASGAPKNEAGQNVINIEYTLATAGHQLEAFFEEFDHGIQYLNQRIGYLDAPQKPEDLGRGAAIAYDFYDEVDNKISRARYLSGFKPGSIYKVQLFNLDAKIVKSNFARSSAELHVALNYKVFDLGRGKTDKSETNIWEYLEKCSGGASAEEIESLFKSGKTWEGILIGPGK